MQPQSNPVHAKGKKNVFCPYYGGCLNYACENYWEYWSCLDCEHRRDKASVTDIPFSLQNSDPYYSISPSLYLKTVSMHQDCSELLMEQQMDI